jgi:hypothetical protein
VAGAAALLSDDVSAVGMSESKDKIVQLPWHRRLERDLYAVDVDADRVADSIAQRDRDPAVTHRAVAVVDDGDRSRLVPGLPLLQGWPDERSGDQVGEKSRRQDEPDPDGLHSVSLPCSSGDCLITNDDPRWLR